MKVTDEMVQRATRARVHTLAMAWDKAERIVLEAALEDEPEPKPVQAMANIRAWAAAAGDAEGRCVLFEERIAALEAKLAKVHAWMQSEAIEASAFDRLHDILTATETKKA